MRIVKKLLFVTFIALGISSCSGPGAGFNEKGEISLAATTVTGSLSEYVQLADQDYTLSLVEKREEIGHWGSQPQVKLKLKFVKAYNDSADVNIGATLISADGQKMSRINKSFNNDELKFYLLDEEVPSFLEMLKKGSGEKEFTFSNNMTYQGTEKEFKEAANTAAKIGIWSETAKGA